MRGFSAEPGAARRFVLLGAVAAIAAATGMALIAAAMLVQPPALTPTAATGSAAVSRFYAAVNAVIATGDPAGLREVVAAHYVERAPLPGVGAGRDGLEEYLTLLHRVDPSLRLEPDVIAGAGAVTVVHVTSRSGRQPPSFAGAMIDPPSPWGAVDVFRVADGTIVERWSQTDGIGLIRPLAAETLSLPDPAPRAVTIDRLALAPGARWDSHAAGPHFLFLQAGTVRVEHRGADVPGSARQSTPLSLTLSAWESSLVPAGASFSVANVGGGAARVIVVTFAVPSSPGGATLEATVPDDVKREILAGGLAAEIGSGQTALTLGQLVLARGAHVSLASTDGASWLAVETGQLGIVAAAPMWVQSDPYDMSHLGREDVLVPGDGAFLNPAGLTVLSNAGDNPVVVLMMTLRQDSDGTSPTPAP